MSTVSMNTDRRSIAAQLARWFTVLLFVSMFVGTHIPGHSLPGFSIGDKIIHFSAYLTLTVSALVSWELTSGVLRAPHFFSVWLVGTLHGAFDEITQTPFGRSCDGMDWLADIAGIISGIVLFQMLRALYYHVRPLSAE